MRSRFNLVLSIAAGALAAYSMNCSPDGGTTSGPGTGSGGTVASGGRTVETGGRQESGGTVASGGTSSATTATTQVGTGGSVGSGGRPSSGGVTSTGGAGRVADAGPPAMGGRTAPATTGAAGAGGIDAGGGGPVTLPSKFVGNIDTRGQIRSDFSKYWNQFTPENAGKWGSVQGSQGSFNWNSLDAMYKYCNDNNVVFKQHNFVWGAQQPGWTSSLNNTTGPQAIQAWMTAFCQRYPKTAIIDVVNEPPPHTTPAYANAIGGGTNSTWDWIANAFKWARQACPNAVLVLNDYNNDELSGDAQHTSDIVNAIKKLNAPIDAVGCQTHGASSMPATTLKTNIDKIASLTGLPVYITEYDINVSDDAKQKAQYQDHFTMFMSNPNIKGVTIWGYIVGATWVANSGIMQSSGAMRPAMTWLMGFLNRPTN